MLDRKEPGPINDEDVRRARALAAQIAIALELTRNLHQSEEHRRRAEALVAIALELNAVLHLPEFMRNFALRAAALLGGRSVALLLQSSEPDMILISGASSGASEAGVEAGVEVSDKLLLRRFRQALDAALPKYPADVAFAPAEDILGPTLAANLGWTDCTLVRLAGSFKSFESMGFHASIEIQSMQKDAAPKIILIQQDWMPYNIEGMTKPNGSQKVYNFSDPDWEVVSKQLSTLYINIKKVREDEKHRRQNYNGCQ